MIEVVEIRSCGLLCYLVLYLIHILLHLGSEEID